MKPIVRVPLLGPLRRKETVQERCDGRVGGPVSGAQVFERGDTGGSQQVGRASPSVDSCRAHKTHWWLHTHSKNMGDFSTLGEGGSRQDLEEPQAGGRDSWRSGVFHILQRGQGCQRAGWCGDFRSQWNPGTRATLTEDHKLSDEAPHRQGCLHRGRRLGLPPQLLPLPQGSSPESPFILHYQCFQLRGYPH